jgi:hypothetical protein
VKEYPTIPNPFLGYGFSATFLAYEFMPPHESYDLLIRWSIVLTGWFYYLYLVYTIHEIAEIRYNGRYEVSPTKATLFHLIPIYNLFWLYLWPNQLGEYIRKKEMKTFFNQGGVIGLIIAGTILAKIDFALGYACITSGCLILIKGMRELTHEAEHGTVLPTEPGHNAGAA